MTTTGRKTQSTSRAIVLFALRQARQIVTAAITEHGRGEDLDEKSRAAIGNAAGSLASGNPAPTPGGS
jgi:hypothetical protein